MLALVLFSVPLARSFHHIFAVEASQTSYRDLRQNAPASVKAVGARTEDYPRTRVHFRLRMLCRINLYSKNIKLLPWSILTIEDSD